MLVLGTAVGPAPPPHSDSLMCCGLRTHTDSWAFLTSISPLSSRRRARVLLAREVIGPRSPRKLEGWVGIWARVRRPPHHAMLAISVLLCAWGQLPACLGFRVPSQHAAALRMVDAAPAELGLHPHSARRFLGQAPSFSPSTSQCRREQNITGERSVCVSRSSLGEGQEQKYKLRHGKEPSLCRLVAKWLFTVPFSPRSTRGRVRAPSLRS